MKKLFSIFLVLVLVVSISGCNYKVFDTNYSYKRAILSMPNGEVIEGKVEAWRDFSDGDQIEVKIDGKTYLVHSSCVTLISE